MSYKGLTQRGQLVDRGASASISSQDELFSRARALAEVLRLLDRALRPHASNQHRRFDTGDTCSPTWSCADQLAALADRHNDPHATIVALQEGLHIADKEVRRLQRVRKSGPFPRFARLLVGSRPAKHSSSSLNYIFDRIRAERDAVNSAKSSLLADTSGITPDQPRIFSRARLSRMLKWRQTRRNPID